MTYLNQERYMTRLNDILESAYRINKVLECVSKEEFCISNIDAQDIVAHRLSIIGEAASAIIEKYSDFCDQDLFTVLRPAKGMRNILIHEYSSVNWETVWKTAQENLPILIVKIESVLNPQKTDTEPC